MTKAANDRLVRPKLARPASGSSAVWHRLAVALVFGVSNVPALSYYMYPGTDRLWLDAHIYYRATQSWLAGENAWASTWLGVPFAAPPPVLLLNVPLMSLGETTAVIFWVIVNLVAVTTLLRRFGLPLWWLMFPPIVEGFLAASPDLALAGLVLVGGGGLAALAKPYSIPALLAADRWRAVAFAFVIGVATIPLLPWQQFLDSRAIVEAAFAEHGVPVSAFGDPILMLAVGVALAILGWRRGLALTTPGLLAQQPHYLVFSLDTIASSRVLTMACAIPGPQFAALGIIVHTILRGSGGQPPNADSHGASVSVKKDLRWRVAGRPRVHDSMSTRSSEKEIRHAPSREGAAQ